MAASAASATARSAPLAVASRMSSSTKRPPTIARPGTSIGPLRQAWLNVALQEHQGGLAALALHGREVGLGHRDPAVGVQAGDVVLGALAGRRPAYLAVSMEPAETAGFTTISAASGQSIASPGAANAVGTTGTRRHGQVGQVALVAAPAQVGGRVDQGGHARRCAPPRRGTRRAGGRSPRPSAPPRGRSRPSPPRGRPTRRSRGRRRGRAGRRPARGMSSSRSACRRRGDDRDAHPIGSRTSKRVSPGEEISRTWPRWFSTMRRTMSRPRPVPLPTSFVVKKGSKSRLWSSAGRRGRRRRPRP